MAVASPALALAATDAQSFSFASRTSVLIQVRFYSTATGDAGSEIPAATGGSRTVTVSTLTKSVVTYPVGVYDPSRLYEAVDVESAIDNQSKPCAGATWTEFEFGPGLSNCTVTATAGANPGGALSYRIWVDVEPNLGK